MYRMLRPARHRAPINHEAGVVPQKAGLTHNFFYFFGKLQFCRRNADFFQQKRILLKKSAQFLEELKNGDSISEKTGKTGDASKCRVGSASGADSPTRRCDGSDGPGQNGGEFCVEGDRSAGLGFSTGRWSTGWCPAVGFSADGRGRGESPGVEVFESNHYKREKSMSMMTENEVAAPTFDAGDVQAEAWEFYRRLVFQAARGAGGEQPETADIQTACWPIKRSLEQFRADVLRARDRIEAAKQLHEAEILAPAIEEARANEEKAVNRLAAAEAEAKRLVEEAADSLAEARVKRERQETERSVLDGPARNRLILTADASLDKQITAAGFSSPQLHNAEADGREAVTNLQHLRDKVARLRQMAVPEHNRYPMPSVQDCEAEIEKTEGDSPKLEEKIALGVRSTERLAEIEQQTAELEQEKLAPEAMAW